MNFINKSYLPESRVQLCCIAEGFPKIKSALENFSVKVIECHGSDNIDTPLRNHADINMYHPDGKNVICSSDNHKLINDMKKHGFNVILSQKPVRSPYPDDVPLNVIQLLNMMFIGRNADRYVKEYTDKNNIKKVIMKQGYIKCTTCIVDNNSVITSDRGTAPIFKKNGIDVLLIEEGGIDLPGYDCGFIGGCSGLIDRNLLAFTGDITKHPSFDKINAFLLERGVKYISLTEERLVDIGSIIPLIES